MYHVSAQGVDERMINVHLITIINDSFIFVHPTSSCVSRPILDLEGEGGEGGRRWGGG